MDKKAIIEELRHINRRLSHYPEAPKIAAHEEYGSDIDFGKLDQIDTERKAEEFLKLANEVDELEKRIERAAGKLLDKHEELTDELDELESNFKSELVPAKDATLELRDYIIEYNSWTNSRTKWKSVAREIPKRAREEMGDEIADAIVDIEEDLEESLNTTYRCMNKLEVIEKESSSKQAGVLEKIREAISWFKGMVNKVVDLYQMAKKRITDNVDKAEDNFEKMFDAFEKAEQ
jgi:hypothetical protein